MPLFRVKVIRDFVVAASDEEEAVGTGFYIEGEVDSTMETITQIKSEADLPPGWTPNCHPYGGDDETTIQGYLKQQR